MYLPRHRGNRQAADCFRRSTQGLVRWTRSCRCSLSSLLLKCSSSNYCRCRIGRHHPWRTTKILLSIIMAYTEPEKNLTMGLATVKRGRARTTTWIAFEENIFFLFWEWDSLVANRLRGRFTRDPDEWMDFRRAFISLRQGSKIRIQTYPRF